MQLHERCRQLKRPSRAKSQLDNFLKLGLGEEYTRKRERREAELWGVVGSGSKDTQGAVATAEDDLQRCLWL